MEAEGLDHVAGTLFELAGKGLIGVLREEFSLFLQRRNILKAIIDILVGDLVPIFFLDGSRNFLGAVVRVHGDHVIGRFAHGVHRAGTGVEHDVVPLELILMDHVVLLSERIEKVLSLERQHFSMLF